MHSALVYVPCSYIYQDLHEKPTCIAASLLISLAKTISMCATMSLFLHPHSPTSSGLVHSLLTPPHQHHLPPPPPSLTPSSHAHSVSPLHTEARDNLHSRHVHEQLLNVPSGWRYIPSWWRYMLCTELSVERGRLLGVGVWCELCLCCRLGVEASRHA